MAFNRFMLLLSVVLFARILATPTRRISMEKTQEYDDEFGEVTPQKIAIMPIVQRDTSNRTRVTQTVEDIMKELPTDGSHDRIGKMLNKSYEQMNRDLEEGETAIREMFNKPQTSNVMKMSYSCLTSSFVMFVIFFLIY